MHRAILSTAVVLVVVLAGCLGGISADGGEPNPGPPTVEWAAGDELNTTVLARHHVERLRAAGNFTVNHTELVRVGGDARPERRRPAGYHPPSVVVHRVDLEDGRYLGTSVTAGDRRSEHFVSPAVTASRRKPCTGGGCDYQYRFGRRPAGDTRSERIDRFRSEETAENLARFLRGVTVGFDYAYAGTVDQGGETLYRYRATVNLTSAPPPFAEPPRGTAEILVTDDGVIRRFELRYTGTATVAGDGEDRTVAVTHAFIRTYSAVGETSVERPDWVDRAAEEDPPRRTETGRG